jgi:hypothetical protein
MSKYDIIMAPIYEIGVALSIWNFGRPQGQVYTLDRKN